MEKDLHIKALNFFFFMEPKPGCRGLFDCPPYLSHLDPNLDYEPDTCLNRCT